MKDPGQTTGAPNGYPERVVEAAPITVSSSTMTDPAAPRMVADDVWSITIPMPYRPRSVHAYLVRIAQASWFLLDGGIDSEEAWAMLDSGVRTVTGGWAAVRLQVVSHMHTDHLGLVRRVLAVSGARLAMGELDASRAAHAAANPAEESTYRAGLLERCGAPGEFIAEIADFPRASSGTFPTVDHPLPRTPAALPGTSGWTAIGTPGHTAGHVSLFREGDRLLLAGDAILPRITPTIGVNRQSEDPVADYHSTLDRLERMSPARAFCGHGDPLEEPLTRIGELREATRAETERVLSCLAPEPASAWEVVERRYPGRNLPTGPRMLALRETLAHLENLVAAERATLVHLRGRDLFAAGE